MRTFSACKSGDETVVRNFLNVGNHMRGKPMFIAKFILLYTRFNVPGCPVFFFLVFCGPLTSPGMLGAKSTPDASTLNSFDA